MKILKFGSYFIPIPRSLPYQVHPKRMCKYSCMPRGVPAPMSAMPACMCMQEPYLTQPILTSGRGSPPPMWGQNLIIFLNPPRNKINQFHMVQLICCTGQVDPPYLGQHIKSGKGCQNQQEMVERDEM